MFLKQGALRQNTGVLFKPTKFGQGVNAQRSSAFGYAGNLSLRRKVCRISTAVVIGHFSRVLVA